MYEATSRRPPTANRRSDDDEERRARPGDQPTKYPCADNWHRKPNHSESAQARRPQNRGVGAAAPTPGLRTLAARITHPAPKRPSANDPLTPNSLCTDPPRRACPSRLSPGRNRSQAGRPSQSAFRRCALPCHRLGQHVCAKALDLSRIPESRHGSKDRPLVGGRGPQAAVGSAVAHQRRRSSSQPTPAQAVGPKRGHLVAHCAIQTVSPAVRNRPRARRD